MRLIYTLLLNFIIFSFIVAQEPIASTITDEFDASGGVKLGPDGFLYVANYGSELQSADGTQIWRINRTTGDKVVFATGLQGASGNDFDSQGNLFQSNIAGGFISKVTPAGDVSTFVSSGINAPVGIAIDDEDNLFVCSCGNNTIRKVTPDATSTAFALGSIFNCPNGIIFDHNGNLYVSNFGGFNNLVKITPDGATSVLAAIPGSNNGHLTYYEPDSVLLVNSHGSSSIYRVTLDGDVTKIAGTGDRGNTDGDALTEATFSRPNGISVSADGDTIWVNSSIPTVDNPGNGFFPLNPSVIRMITGFKEMVSSSAQVGLTNLNFELFPNPATTSVQVEMTLNRGSNLQLFLLDVNGKMIFNKDLGWHDSGVSENSINLDKLMSGVYYICLKGDEFSSTRQLLLH